MAGIEHERVLRTLERLETALVTAEDRDAFGDAVAEEFTWMKSAGWDGRGGGVLFTGYADPHGLAGVQR